MSNVEITVMSKEEITALRNSLLAEIQLVFTAINKLPNQIVGPTLEEIYRNLEPIGTAATQTKIEASALRASLQTLVDGLPDMINSEVMRAIQVEMTPHLKALNARLDAFAGQARQKEFNHEVAFCMLETAALAKTSRGGKGKRPETSDGYDPENVFKQLQKFKPKLYPVWKKLFAAAKKSYIEAPNLNCSTWTSREARAFRAYVKLLYKGQVLDIGCGPYANPIYLQGLPTGQLTAIEPLDLVAEPAFPVFKGVNEFIPFNNKSFDTIVNATSFDHVIDVERALEETARVLRKGGHFIIWYANVTTAPNPVTDYDGPLDDYHLFHTNDEWFLPMLERYFHIKDRRVFAANATIDNVFACLTLKH